jgi:hypothetical protein
MSGESPEPTEATSAKDLHDEIVAMFEEALARKFGPEPTAELDAPDAGVADVPLS